MQCPTCGSAIAPGDAFCPKCGADVRAASSAPPPPGTFPQPPPPAATQPLPSPEPPPFPAGQQPPAAQQPKRSLSTGAIVGIVSAVIVGVLLLGVGGFFALRAFAPKGEPSDVIVAKPDSSSIVASPAPSADATESGESTAAEPPSASTVPPVTSESAEVLEEADPGVVTDAEARAVVKKFMDLRVARKINASKAYCTRKMLTGENGSFINDKYWRPDSYKIKKTTPDLMYIHVAVMGMWPSGNEPTIYSVFRDPKSGKVLIDDMIDPENSPELWK
jgi:hypothetical protein